MKQEQAFRSQDARDGHDEQMRVAFVSTYPPKSEKHVRTGGVASYSRNLVCALSESGTKTTVFADKMKTVPMAAYEEEDVRVIRCWSKGWRYPFQLSRILSSQRDSFEVLHIQHEYFLFGGLIGAAMFPLLLFLLRVFVRKPAIVTLHGVMSLSEIDASFVRRNGLTGHPMILRTGIRAITWLSAMPATKIVVHERCFADALHVEYGVREERLSVIPHGVEVKTLSSSAGREAGPLETKAERTILFFGYLAGYKGLEVLVEAFRHLAAQGSYRLIIAGGLHPRLKDDPKYRRDLAMLKRRAREVSNRIRFTGFVEEAEIPELFRSVDVAVFPYTQVVSSSGPFSLAIAYRTPALLSASLARSLSATETVFAFENTSPALAKCIEGFFEEDGVRDRTLAFMDRLRSEREWPTVARRTLALYRNVDEKRRR